MSAKCQKRTSPTLFDHLVGLREQRGRDHYAERLSRLEIDHQFVRGRCLHRHIGRLLTLEEAIDITGRAPVWVDRISPIANQPAVGDEEAQRSRLRATCVGRPA